MMLTPTLIVFSNISDESVRAVLPHLSARTIPFVLDLSEFTHTLGSSVEIEQQTKRSVLHLPNETIQLENVRAVWWWRPGRIRRRYELMPYHSDFVLQESEDFIEGLLSIMPSNVRWYNHFDAHRMSSRKIVQMNAAVESGLRIPETLITTNLEEATKFIDRYGPAVLKNLHRSGSGWHPTRKLSGPQDPTLMETIAVGSAFLQRYVNGPEDFRVIVMDDYLQAVSFDLNTCTTPEDSSLDLNMSCRATDIPNSLSEKIRKCLHKLNLRYGAFDFRKDDRGEFFFFEVNPGGYFLHLDQRASTNITQNIARILSTS